VRLTRPLDPDRARRRRNRRLWATLFVLGCGLGSVWTFQRPLFHKNFGVIDPDRVYRSAQPGPELAAVIRARRLGSILNLRGGSQSDTWYASEVQTTERAGVDLYDFPMSATRRPMRRELLVLVDVFTRCRYPMLIHCKSGSDRTGLASAVYLMVAKGVPPESAVGAFSVQYGHVPLLSTARLHEPFEEYAAWLKTRGIAHDPERFRRWVECDYRSDDPATVFRPINPGPRAERRRTATTGEAALRR
jgi:protein tyrosine phosphatase (PTP) superfamily phosphohydrolase (DUF442 family)